MRRIYYMKKILLTVLSLFLVLVGYAQPNPVKVSHELKVDGHSAELVFKAAIDPGWHVYSVEVVEDGPTPASLNVEKIDGMALVGGLVAQPKAKKVYEEMFEADVYYHEGSVVFIQKLELTSDAYSISGYLEYGACNDQTCIPPTSVDFEYSGQVEGESAEADEKTQEETSDVPEAPDTEGIGGGETVDNDGSEMETSDSLEESTSDVDFWAPVGEVKTYDEVVADSWSSVGEKEEGYSLWTIFILGFSGGLLALVTPCVWPIIPMTVSYFLKRGKAGKKGVRDAIVYGISIVVIYMVLGLAVTAAFGADALNSLSTNALFNVFFFLLLVVFALSFFGMFEIKLPSSWSNAVDDKADKVGGMLGIFLMAFTLTLVSFSCTGPIIGFLLVEVSVMGNVLGPSVGMFGFALALALPFALFAMFPQWMQSMPKSGSWMNTVKVVLGFIELFFAFKFLSVADMAYHWHILDRDVFVLIWILLALALGLYLLGVYHFPHEEKQKKVSILRKIFGLASILFAVYMVPGLWGSPLKAISAFTPPMSTQHWKLVDNEVKPQFNDFDEGMEYARKVGKPVFLDFTGYGCVNCRKMEAAVWTDPQVAEKLNDEFVLIQLFVDDKTKLSDAESASLSSQYGQRMRTVGQKWSYLQNSKFGANAQPFYVILDNEGRLMDGSYSYDEDVLHFLRFLNDGLNSYYPPVNDGH